MRDLTKDVESILSKYPQSRDSDQWLTLKIWKEFYPQHLDMTDSVNPKADFATIMKILPREDNVKRIRATFQNVKKMYPPTSLAVVKRRKQNQDVWRKLISGEYKRI